MNSKYIIRLDDASHFSNEEKWDRIESILRKFQIKPIIAVGGSFKSRSFFDKCMPVKVV